MVINSCICHQNTTVYDLIVDADNRKNVEFSHLGHNTVKCDENQPTFRSNIPPSSTLDSCLVYSLTLKMSGYVPPKQVDS
jgi:hypothetical protein